MKKLLLAMPLIFFCCETEDANPCANLGCNLICESGYILDENGCQTCQCIDYRDQYIGDWEFNSYTAVSHPYDPSSSDQNWIGEITYGNSDSTLFIPHGPIIEGYDYCFCYEFQINIAGEINDDTYDANNFNYYFDGYINADSLYYSTVEGSPFSATSQTIYGSKIY